MDTRIERVAQVLVAYSVRVRPGDWVVISGHTVAEPLLKALYQEVLAAGGHPQIVLTPSWEAPLFYRHASEEQLAYVSPLAKQLVDKVDIAIDIWCDTNTKALTTVDPGRKQRRRKARAPLMQRHFERTAEKSLRWVGVLYPTDAFAQDAEMSLEEYEAFFYGAALVNEADPIARWTEVRARQQRLVDWLAGRDEIHIRGANADLRLSIKGRSFLNAAGEENFPDGEIYTSPVEHSANGWVAFTYPAVVYGVEVTGIEFTFENGQIVKATAKKNEEALTGLLDTDPGARYLGELGIGTNPGITRFTSNTLFDEKIQGTFHLAIGAGFPEVGGTNQSAIHVDIVCDLQDGEMTVDGEPFYRHGNFVV